jgi:hypothetical protein
VRIGGADSHMKVIEIRDKFGVDSLQLVERPDRVPGPGQVVLKMKAFSINYRDLLVVNGVGRRKPPLGRVPLSASEPQSVVRFEPLNSLTNEVHHAIREAVHRTGDLDGSLLFQIRQYWASPPNVFDC